MLKFNKIEDILVLILLLIVFLSASSTFASNIEGTSTFEDYLFVLVHGINGGSNHFNGQDHRDKELRLLQRLESDLGLQGHVYAYSFKDNKGSSIYNAREFGDRSYANSASYINKDSNYLSMDGKCWLEKAKADFHARYPAKPIPSKYIIIAHSMGNMAIRLYVYSKEMGFVNGGFYQDDIAKVVFVAPPFTGSDLAYPALLPKTFIYGIQAVREKNAWADLLRKLFSNENNFLVDPYAPYKTAKTVSSFIINLAMYQDYIEGLYGSGGRAPDLADGGGYSVKDDGTIELIPEEWKKSFGKLLSAKLDDPAKEPSYSVVYGTGGPVLNISDLAKNKVLGALVKSNINLGDTTTEKFNLMPGNGSWKFPGEVGGLFNNLGSEIDLLMPGSGFYNMSTAQAKFVSLVMSDGLIMLSEDGDSAVPVHSAKGLFEDKFGGGTIPTAHLKNAAFYSKAFKGRFNDFLEKELPDYIVGAGVAYAGMRFVGIPHETALPIVQWSLSLLIIEKVIENRDDIAANNFIHTNTMLKQYDLIEKAMLDTPAIFTINDLQANASSEGGGSPEATALSFSVGAPVPSGYESLKVKLTSENRNVSGFTSMPVPMTLRAMSATGEGDRKYATSIMLTKPPQRIVGKLNYLVPKLMKSFEYSFNFAAWKPIEGVDPETGEFVLEELPFAEGQNVLAIKSVNAVNVESNQILRFMVNSIPLLPTAFTPQPNFYLNQTSPLLSVEFNKSEYSGNYEDEKINIKEMLVDGVAVAPQVQSSMESYHPWAKASYQVPSDAPLSEGEHRIAVKAESNVGISQGLWSFFIDRSPPLITVEAIAPYSAASPMTIRYSSYDQMSPNLRNVSCDLYDSSGKLVANIATAESPSKGENFFNWDGAGMKGLDG